MARAADLKLELKKEPEGVEPAPKLDAAQLTARFEKILASPVPVIVYVSPSGSRAASAGFFILQAADERLMAPNSVQMIHYGNCSLSAQDKTASRQMREIERIDLWMERMYLDKIHQKIPGFKLSKLRSMLDHDTFLTAEMSVRLGLADKILE